MPNKFTTGLLKLHAKYPQDIVTPDGHYTVARTLPQPTIAAAEANARRLLACWNMLVGETTEDIEANPLPAMFDQMSAHLAQLQKNADAILAQRDELLDALKECIEDSEQAVCEYIEKYGETYRPQRLQAMRNTVAKARAAIAKAGGGA